MVQDSPWDIRHLQPVGAGRNGGVHMYDDASHEPTLGAEGDRPREPLAWPGSGGGSGAAEARPDASQALIARLLSEMTALRERVDTLEGRLKGQLDAQRVDMEQAYELVQGELAQARQAAQLAERHEQMINQLRTENVHGAASLQRINEEQILILNQLMGRIGGIQTDLVQQRSRIKGLLVAVGSTALAVAAVIALLVALYFLP